MWPKINGKPCRLDVKYSTSKKAIIRYFARRLSLAGLGLPVSDWVHFLKNKQLLNTFGIERKPSVSPENHYKLVDIRNNYTKKTVLYLTFLGTLPKSKAESVPPPLSEWGYS